MTPSLGPVRPRRAVAIVAGLMVAAVLMMVVIPVFYAIFFRVKYEPAQLA